MAIFPNIERHDRNPKRLFESSYNFLNRTAVSKYDFVRTLVNDWFSKYPNDHKPELKSKLTSRNELVFYSAFFELYVFTLLTQLGYSVEIHPNVKRTTKRPDFLVKGQNEHFFLEALTTNLKSEEETARKKIQDFILDRIHRLEIEKYFLDVDLSGKPPKKQPSANKIANEIENWITEIENNNDSADGSKEFNFNKWSIQISLIPRSNFNNYDHPRSIGSISHPVNFENKAKLIRKRIEQKANRYVKFDHPFILALNLLPYSIFTDTFFEALFGKDFNNSKNTSPFLLSNDFNLDGALVNNNCPTNTRISAILYGKTIMPTTVGDLSMRMIINPFSENPYGGKLTSLTGYYIKNNNLEKIQGKDCIKILDLPNNWPIPFHAA